MLISHGFSSVRMADRILVLADGKVEAMGTHEELLALGGCYAELSSSRRRDTGELLMGPRSNCGAVDDAGQSVRELTRSVS